MCRVHTALLYSDHFFFKLLFVSIFCADFLFAEHCLVATFCAEFFMLSLF